MKLKTLFMPRKLVASLKARWSLRTMLNRAIKNGVKRFESDPNYRLDLVPANFAPRMSPREDNSAILKRIVAAYQKAMADQRSAGSTFNVSNEWLPIYERTLGPVMKALNENNLAELDRMYSNFFRDSCSTGLAGMPSQLEQKCFGAHISKRYRIIALCEGIHRYNLWKERTENAYTAQDLSTPLIGNPWGSTMDGVFLAPGVDYQHFYAHEIKALLSSCDSNIVAELGGGFGGMAYFLVRDIPEITYVDFDLPEALALASFYLMKAFPGLPIQLYGEAELTPKTLSETKILMMPSFEILRMAPKSVAIAFNSYSLAEMSPAAVRQYVDEIIRFTSGYFLHVNHNKNAALRADDFGVEARGFELVRRNPSGWTAGLNPNSDEFEYLYKAK